MQRMTADIKDGFQMTMVQIRVNPSDPCYPRAISTDDNEPRK
jgi:hypothetical protein